MANTVCRLKDRLATDKLLDVQIAETAADIYCNEFVLMEEDDIAYVEVAVSSIDDEWELWRVECITPGSYATVRINEK